LFIFLIVVLLSKIWLLVHVQHFLREDLPDVNNPHITFVAGDDPEAVATTIALVETIPGFKGANAGPLENSRIVELFGPRWMIELDKLNAGGKLSMYRKLGV
jgi:predicted dinucleotide-binding enzyme